ncbi:hypothetical protein SAMN05880574_10638 [Chryseobacterium sp. RU37D]|nr:hypothetical protein SAMN05880574_10638 [Chryseobacterium sp. RU37D]
MLIVHMDNKAIAKSNLNPAEINRQPVKYTFNCLLP